MIKEVAFFIYPVSNIATARGFYEGALGLTLSRSFQNEWLEYDIGATTLVVATADAEHPAPLRGGGVALEVDDLDGYVGRLKGLGARFKGGICETPVCRIAVVLDPDGSEIMLHQRKATPKAA